jgi:hypothetical protein
MKRSAILVTIAVLGVTAGIVARIDAAMSSSGEAIALALTSAAPAAPLLAAPSQWGFAARYEADEKLIVRN